MNKNAQNLFQFLLVDSFGYGRTGLTPTVKISKDGGAFAVTTNTATQVSAADAPGLYQIVLTDTECACDVLAIAVTLSNGDMPAVLAHIAMEEATLGLLQKVHGLLGAWSLDGTTLTTQAGDATVTYTLTKTKGQITAISEDTASSEEDDSEEASDE